MLHFCFEGCPTSESWYLEHNRSKRCLHRQVLSQCSVLLLSTLMIRSVNLNLQSILFSSYNLHVLWVHRQNHIIWIPFVQVKNVCILHNNNTHHWYINQHLIKTGTFPQNFKEVHVRQPLLFLKTIWWKLQACIQLEFYFPNLRKFSGCMTICKEV